MKDPRSMVGFSAAGMALAMMAAAAGTPRDDDATVIDASRARRSEPRLTVSDDDTIRQHRPNPPPQRAPHPLDAERLRKSGQHRARKAARRAAAWAASERGAAK